MFRVAIRSKASLTLGTPYSVLMSVGMNYSVIHNWYLVSGTEYEQQKKEITPYSGSLSVSIRKWAISVSGLLSDDVCDVRQISGIHSSE